jgi:pSer/pThr/pTyr-binding forkhead associated (FHA) protein
VQVRLIVVEGNAQAREFDLDLPAVIGRSRSTDLTLGHPLISRRHCEVFDADGQLMLRDLGSLNGTFVGGDRLGSEAVTIQNGARFTVGPVTFEAQYRRAGAASSVRCDAAHPTLDAPLAGLSGVSQNPPPLPDLPDADFADPHD